MVCFTEIKQKEFLTDYWQKKPLVIRKAIPDFVNYLTPEELAGLAMEEEMESRIVIETPNKFPYWQLKKGPFLAKDFHKLPKTNWTLLVQGVDRVVPEIAALLDNFNFIPQWRVDDVMISYAVEQGSVGPHYDNYDVFLYQAKGQRKWSLTTRQCNEHNCLEGVDLRIMKEFYREEEYVLAEGDMLYLPPHVGHYGIAVSNECMTYSFGYRSYQGQELWDSFAEYLAEQQQTRRFYCDPCWDSIQGAAEVPQQAVQNAKQLMQQMLDDEEALQSWFGCFVTQLDQQADALLPIATNKTIQQFNKLLKTKKKLLRNPLCRFAYQEKEAMISLFINGTRWEIAEVAKELVKLVANARSLTYEDLHVFLHNEPNQRFLLQLWNLQWLEFN